MERSLHQLVLYFNSISQDYDRFIIAVDGPGGSGKTFFVEKLFTFFKGCEIVHLDDFYLPESDPEIIGSSFDWHRLIEQVLLPFTNHLKCKYQIHNWTTHKLDSWKEIHDTKFLIIEGVTSGRLELREYLNFIIFIEASFETRLMRGIERDGTENKDKWLKEWMPNESKYFDSAIHKTKLICDLVIDGTFTDISNIDRIKTIYEKNNYFS